MDSFHKQGGAESEFKRIKVDIEDLCLGEFAFLSLFLVVFVLWYVYMIVSP